jgi:hypothetical protein
MTATIDELKNKQNEIEPRLNELNLMAYNDQTMTESEEKEFVKLDDEMRNLRDQIIAIIHENRTRRIEEAMNAGFEFDGDAGSTL